MSAFCRACVVFVLMVVCLGSLPTAASNPRFSGLLQRWLDRPGVRVVAVEIYSDSCEPCKAAAPEWEALRKRYERDGLMLVALNIDEYDSAEQCKKLPWKPDVLKCDPALGAELGVEMVPQSFVWTWQGELLVSGRAHVAEARRAVSYNPWPSS